MNISKLVRSGLTSLAATATLLTATTAVASAATVTWDGGGGANNNFSTAANWAGDVVPVAGDVIALPVLGSSTSTVTLNNDINAAFAGVNVGESNKDRTVQTNYLINTIQLSNDATIQHVNASGSNLPNVQVQYGNITAIGNLILNNANLSSQNLNQPDSTVAGNLVLNDKSSLTINIEVSGTITVGNESEYVLYGSLYSGITIQNGGALFVSGTVDKPLTFGGGAGTTDPTILVSPGDTATLTGQVVLQNNVRALLLSGKTLTVSGAISGSSFAIAKTQESTGTLVINSSNNTSATPNGAQETAVQTITITDAQPLTTLEVLSKQIVILNGERGDTTVYSGGILKGSGKTGLIRVSGGTIAPGQSPGCLTSTGLINVAQNGIFQTEIGGTEPCTGYDQLKVNGTVGLTDGSFTFKSEVSLFNGFVPVAGQSYTIIDNDGADAVAGIFEGLAEGATFVSTGVTYRITYVGGDGNDVVLTVQSVDASQLPTAPDTGFSLVVAQPLMVLGVSMTAGLALLLAARKLKYTK